MKIQRIADGVNVSDLLWRLQEHPELWDENNARTKNESSPHYGLSDIWVRYAAPSDDNSKPHDAVWYPSADILGVKDMIYPLISAVRGTKLGGVLITKIPAGKECKPHIDDQWHAKHYQKFAIQIQSAPGQEFCFEGESLVTKPGDVFWFDNSFTHWVTNPTPYDRITLIACIKKED